MIEISNEQMSDVQNESQSVPPASHGHFKNKNCSADKEYRWHLSCGEMAGVHQALTQETEICFYTKEQ